MIAPFEPTAVENCALNDMVATNAVIDEQLADECDPARAAILIAQRNQAFEDLIFTISSSLDQPVREICEADSMDLEKSEPTTPDWDPAETGLHLAQLVQ
jgi:hypothetical protein